MPRHHLLRLGCLALAVVPLSAADLPIVRITIGPDGALVERAGTLPAGDEAVTGLPVGLDAEHVTLTIAGVDTPPAIRFELPAPVVPPPPEAAWQARLAAAQTAFDAAQPAFELAELRATLARGALALLPAPPAPPTAPPADATVEAAAAPPALERPLTTGRPVPTPAAQSALLAFVATNLQRAEEARAAALRDRSVARAQLIALDEERESARPAASYTARLPLPGAGGHEVHLRYLVERAAWAPVYRIVAEAGVVTLVREALIDVPRDQGWTQGRLELVSRPAGEDLVLRDLQVPVLELGDEAVVTRQGGGKHRAIAVGGGSRASESSVNVGLRAAKRLMQGDGSIPGGAWTTHVTALNVLAWLGAGYDHKTASRYRSMVALGLGWLAQHDHAGDLAGQALVTMALAEAVAMTSDEQLTPHAERALAALAERVGERHELDFGIYRRGPMVGPELLAWVTMAARSSAAANLSAAHTAALFAAVRRLLPELDGHADRDEAGVARLACQAFLGHLERSDAETPPVSDWVERVGRWEQDGRPELVYLATLGLFQFGGQPWNMWNATVRDRLVALNDIGDRSGWLAATPSPLGEGGAAAFLTLPLEVYYRYKQVGKGSDAKGLFANRAGAPEVAELTPLPNLALSAHQWPVRLDAGPARLSDGERVRVQLGRTVLPGHLALAAAPADGPGAWRVLATVNPLAAPLPAGDAEVEVDGERLGTAQLPFTEPGARLDLRLGRDDRVLVARSEERTDDEAWNRRMRTTTVHLRVDAPPGLYASIRLDEAMPVPRDPSIQLVSLAPALAPEELDRRLVEDPVWHLDLDLRHPPARVDLTWQLRYPVTVRPTVGRTTTQKVELNGTGTGDDSPDVQSLDLDQEQGK